MAHSSLSSRAALRYGATRKEMASRTGITQADYAQIEAGRRIRKETLKKAAAARGHIIKNTDWDERANPSLPC
ncbi:MAG TPA: helix-turn-helix transcriptional regulator [Nitrosomonas europaea]|nr:helix-turn-helix transcriptional regulator [Nitrosomonas europaea]